MACILNIETATEICSVVVASDGNIIFERENTKGPSHATLLGVFVEEALAYMRSQKIRLDAVAVSCGPGSYTGLRIGVSEAKGLCYGLGIPLIAVGTLKILAHSVAKSGLTNSDTLLCPMIDARRMEVYDEVFDPNLKQLREVNADIIDEDSFAHLLANHKIAFFGNGANKCKHAMQSDNAIFLDGIYARAKDMVQLSEEAFQSNNFVDVAYFEPFYLKEFVATIAKNKVLPAT